MVDLLHGQAHGLGKWQEKFRAGKYYSGIVFTIPFFKRSRKPETLSTLPPLSKSPLPCPDNEGLITVNGGNLDPS